MNQTLSHDDHPVPAHITPLYLQDNTLLSSKQHCLPRRLAANSGQARIPDCQLPCLTSTEVCREFGAQDSPLLRPAANPSRRLHHTFMLKHSRTQSRDTWALLPASITRTWLPEAFTSQTRLRCNSRSLFLLQTLHWQSLSSRRL